MSKFVSIAIDGPAGAGKSTMARACARELGILYVDTGAIYRTVGYYMRLMGVGPKDRDGIARLIDEVNIDIRYEDGVQQVYLNGENVSNLIRTEEVSDMTSRSSAIAQVRAKLTDLQRDLAARENVLMDGRDIGTTILPNAQLKIYLTASVEVRALRRYKEYLDKGEKNQTLAEVEKDVENRDYRDMHRDVSPLCQAEDAVYLDSSEMTIEEVVDHIVALARERMI